MNELSSPIAQVKEVISYCAIAQLGDGRHHAFVLAELDAFGYFGYEVLSKTGTHAFLRAVTLIDEQVQQFVHFFVGKPELAFIGLPFPQISGGRLGDDFFWDIQGLGELSDLDFVEIP